MSLSALIVGFLGSLLFIERIFGFIMRPLQAVLPDGGKLIYTEPAEAFLLYMKVAALIGLFLASPVVLWQIWKFIAPGLYPHEKRFAIPFVVFSTVFFVAGELFSHFVVFPWAWTFFAQFSTDYMQFTPKIARTFSMYVRMMLAMGAVFEMPTVVFFLARVGLVTKAIEGAEDPIQVLKTMGADIFSKWDSGSPSPHYRTCEHSVSFEGDLPAGKRLWTSFAALDQGTIRRERIVTPFGALTHTWEYRSESGAPFESEHWWKDLSEYPAIRYWLDDTEWHPVMDALRAGIKRLGDDGTFIYQLLPSPLKQVHWFLWSHRWLPHGFSVEFSYPCLFGQR